MVDSGYGTLFPGAAAELPEDYLPRLPDGTLYDGTEGDAELVKNAKSILMNLVGSHEFRAEHSHLLRMVLDTHMEQIRIRRELKAARSKGEADVVAHYTKANDQLGKTLVRLYKDLGLLDKKGRETGPFQLVQDLRARVPEFLKKHGMERTMACQSCGHMQLVYLIAKVDVEIDWERVRVILSKEEKLPKAFVDKVIQLMSKLSLTTRGDIKTRFVDHPLTHPFLSDPDFPIWSSEVRDMMKQSCKCGAPKLTMDEAAEILRVSPAGLDQLLQEDNRRNGLEPIPGVAGESAGVFTREGETS